MSRKKWKTELDGITYRSGFEAKVATKLKENKVKFSYEVDKIKYVVPESYHTYTPDFTLPNGIVLEVKGRFTPADRKKMSLVIEQNPTLDIRLIFMTDNTLSRTSKTRYSDWCNKRNIKYHVSKDGSIPSEWYEVSTKKRK